MAKKLLIKIKSINLMVLLKNFILNGVKMAVTYQITIFLLGYALFTPLLVRLFNITPKNNVAECFDWGFNVGSKAPAVQQSMSGLTWDQIILGGVVFGAVFFSLHFAQNYFTENLYPPLMRSMGYDYYSLKEKNTILLDKANIVLEQNQMAARVIDHQYRTINALNEKIGVVDNNLLAIHRYLTDTSEGSLLHKIRFDFDIVHGSINETRNTIIEMQRGPLRLIQEKLMVLERSLGSVSSMTADLTSRPIPNFRDDLAEITSLFRDFQTNVLNTLSEPISTLRAQVLALETFEPNELHTVTDRLRQTLGAFEHLAGQVRETGANIEAAMQTSADRITEYENQVALPERSTIVSGSSSGAPNSVPTEAYVGGVAAARERLNNENIDYTVNSSGGTATITQTGVSVGDNTQEVSQFLGRPTSGHYIIEQHGDELLIRLSLRGVNVPLQEMATTGSMNTVGRFMQQAMSSELVVGGVATALTTYAPKILYHGTLSLASVLGYAPLYRSITNAPRVAAAENKIEAVLEGAKTGAIALFNVITK